MFEGSAVALVTPFKDGKLDKEKFEKLIEFQIKEGTDVLLFCGTTGESATLTHEEQRDVIKVGVEIVNKRVPVLAGAGSNSTAEAVRLTRFAMEAGADGVLSVVPYYNKPTQQGLYLHFEAVAKEAGDFPIVLYNVPGRTVASIAPETVARLFKIPNIIAIKEASGSLEQVSKIKELCDITVLSGDDALTLPMMKIGAKGVVSVAANVAPRDVADMVHAFNNNDLELAEKLHNKLMPLFDIMFIETNPIPVKTSLALMGMINKDFRLPLCDLMPENEEKLKQELKDYGLI
jgi:4-hydroxy-tetrahydrodipicolinate synthase